jgi:hypothetical protein
VAWAGVPIGRHRCCGRLRVLGGSVVNPAFSACKRGFGALGGSRFLPGIRVRRAGIRIRKAGTRIRKLSGCMLLPSRCKLLPAIRIPLRSGYKWLPSGCKLLGSGCKLLVSGCKFPVAGCTLLVSGRWVAEHRTPVIRRRMHVVGHRRQGSARMCPVRHWTRDLDKTIAWTDVTGQVWSRRPRRARSPCCC